MARIPFAAVESDPGAPAGPCTVEITLVWGGEPIATAHSRRGTKAGALFRASDAGERTIAALFEDLPLARAEEDGRWTLLLANGEPAPEGTRLSIRTGKAVLRVRLVAPATLALPRAKSDGRVRRAFVGATIVHLAIVLVALLKTSSPVATPSRALTRLVPALVDPAAFEATEEGSGPGLTLVAPAVDAPPSRMVQPPASDAPERFGMIALARDRDARRSRSALTFERFDPPKGAIAMFTPSIDEAVSVSGLGLSGP